MAFHRALSHPSRCLPAAKCIRRADRTSQWNELGLGVGVLIQATALPEQPGGMVGREEKGFSGFCHGCFPNLLFPAVSSCAENS